MNGQQGRGGRGEDPIEEFFAAHRAQVRDEPADDLTWHRIKETRQRARAGRRGAWTGALVAAAAALAIVVGPSLLPSTNGPDVAGPAPTETSTSTSTATSTGTPTNESVADPLVVTTQVPDGELPADGRFTDVTTADPESTNDTGVRYAVVTHSCETSGWCSVLARSDDAGTTWAPRADLEQLGMVHRVLFTDHERGWVWGDKSDLWATTDGGRTWSEVDTGGDYVADLAVQGDELLAVTGTYDDCAEAPCQSPSGSVLLTDPTDIGWTDDVITELGPVEQARIIGAGDGRYVLTHGEDGWMTSVLRLQEGQLEPTAALSDCAGGPLAVTASADDPGHLWALCDDQRGLALQQTDNGARTWSPANRTVPSFVLGEQPPLMASTGADHLLLVGEGNYALTTDGGQTWSAEAFLPGADARPERLAVTMFGEVIAYPTQEQATAGLAYWRSGDGGVTWETVDLP